MKAITYTTYGPPDVLQLKDVPKPAPQDDEVLIKVHASAVTTGDVNMRGFVFVPPSFGPLPRLMFGLRAPRKPILGVVLAGEVEAVGSAVRAFKPGDAVFGINANRIGAYAEYVCWPEASALALKPANLTYEEAAALPFGGGTALFFLQNRVQPGQSVLVNGASGGVGSYAVQLARHYGATVTGVCSTANVDLVRSLGADEVIDYTREDFAQRGAIYDVIIDTVVGKSSFARCAPALKPAGTYLAVAGGIGTMLRAISPALQGGKKVVAGSAPENKESLAALTALAEEGALKPVIDRRYPLAQMVEAHRYVDQGHKKGSVVITVG